MYKGPKESGVTTSTSKSHLCIFKQSLTYVAADNVHADWQESNFIRTEFIVLQQDVELK